MITLGTAKEMYKLEGYPAELKTDIREILNILDMNYGENREYFKVGGFVGIVVICGDFQKLFLVGISTSKASLVSILSKSEAMLKSFSSQIPILLS